MSIRKPRARRASETPRFIVVTGLSGAGKSQAIRTLEDLGYFCVDNLPLALIPTFAALTIGRARKIPRAAVVVDIRGGRELSRFPAMYRRLKRQRGLRVALIFLDAEDRILLRRFSETRRPHPLAPTRSAAEGLREERRRLQAIRELADRIVDTSRLSVHELRRAILGLASGAAAAPPLAVTILTFGFKHGVPPDADLVFDVRFLPNPHFVPGLRALTGLNPKVSRYVMRSAPAKRFMRLTTALLRFLLPEYIAEGKAYLTIAIGCTGGRHRSIAIGEALGRQLKKERGVVLRVVHRDPELE